MTAIDPRVQDLMDKKFTGITSVPDGKMHYYANGVELGENFATEEN